MVLTLMPGNTTATCKSPRLAAYFMTLSLVRLSLHYFEHLDQRLSLPTATKTTQHSKSGWAFVDKYYPDGDTRFCNDRHLAVQAAFQPWTWSLPESSFWWRMPTLPRG
jgi:hypothetical protein